MGAFSLFDGQHTAPEGKDPGAGTGESRPRRRSLTRGRHQEQIGEVRVHAVIL